MDLSGTILRRTIDADRLGPLVISVVEPCLKAAVGPHLERLQLQPLGQFLPGQLPYILAVQGQLLRPIGPQAPQLMHFS